jgi:hypothetical protein
MQDKIVLLTMNIQIGSLQLSQHTCVIHIQFTNMCYVLPQSSDPLQNFLKHAHWWNVNDE